MLKYGRQSNFKCNRLHPLNIDRQSISLVPSNTKVLEIGCATGFMGEYLKKHKHCVVVGVEQGFDEARAASLRLDKVIRGNIEEQKILKRIKKLGKFDVILAAAVVEHLKDPWASLSEWKKLLKINGFLVITTSNITHWSVRLHMMLGKFEYEEYGILDDTHLRFFTPGTFKRLIEDCGYRIEYFAIDPVGGGFPKISLVLAKLFPNLFAYQMVIKATTF